MASCSEPRDVDDRDEESTKAKPMSKAMRSLVRRVNNDERKPKQTTAQIKRQTERQFRERRKSDNERKRRETLRRAARPRTKRYGVTSSKRGSDAIAMLPPPETDYEETLRKLRETQSQERVDMFVRNYNNWLSRRCEGLVLSAKEAESLSQSFSTRPTGVSSEGGAPTQAPITAFMKPTAQGMTTRVKRFYRRYYYERVRTSDQELDVPLYSGNGDPPGMCEEMGGPEVDHRVRTHRSKGRVTALECKKCNIAMHVDKSTGDACCRRCGLATRGQHSVAVSFADIQSSSRSAAPYERKAHFKEFITRLEGGERTEIPEAVINALLNQCVMHRIDPVASPEEITYQRVREFLKIKGYSHFYENITQIISILTRRPPRRFTPEQREKLTQIFQEIQGPFERHKGDRKNFLSYAYATYKSCELLGLDEFLPNLPLLKAPKNLLRVDSVWRKVCEECKYEFIPTT